MKTPQIALLRISAACLIALALLLPLPRMASAEDQAWNGEYFANMELAGSPALVRSNQEMNFNWGLGSPDSSIPVDHFSARWTRRVYFPAGQFRFNVTVDDGVRLFVDNQPVIDQWRVTAPITYTSSIALGAGDHDVRLEYFENTERAIMHLWWEQDSTTTTTTSLPAHAGTWRGHYFDNRDLSGDPKFERDEPAIFFDWGANGPGGDISGHDFSARWKRSLYLPAGHYLFKTIVDDGVRIWLDGATVIDQWHDSTIRTYQREIEVSEGNHTMVVEYYQASGTAQIAVSWQNTAVDWVGNLSTCMPAQHSWVKVYRLSPNNQWEDLKPAGYGPSAASGELKIWGLPIDPIYGWDGQPYIAELWVDGKLVRSDGKFFDGQPQFVLTPGADVHTSWPCGAAVPTQ